MIAEKPIDHHLCNPDWKIEYKWLICEYIYSQKLKQWQETLFCSYCQEYYAEQEEKYQKNEINNKPESNSLILGSYSFNKTRLQEHLKTKNQFHFNAECYKFGLKQGNKQNQLNLLGFNKLFQNQKIKASDQLLLPLFYMSYFIAKEDLPILKYENLKLLLNILEVDQNESYGSRKFCNEFLNSVYIVMFEQFIEQIKYNKYVSISIDSTQIQFKKQEILAITVRYLDSNYNLQEKFMTVKEMQSLKAEGYYQVVVQTLEEFKLIDSIMFLNTDGAPTVSSQQNGLSGLLKKKIPYLISTQCIVHKVSLGVKDMAKQFQYVKDLNYYVYSLASFLNTKKRLDLLSENERNLLYGDDQEILNLIQPIDVRWISYYPSIQRIIKHLLPIIETLYQIQEENETPNLKIIIQFFGSLKNILLVATYGDLLQPVFYLTKQLQKENISLLSLESDTQTCIQKLQELKENDGELIRELYQRLDINKQNQLILDDYHIFENSDILFEMLKEIENQKDEMLDFLIMNLKNRFQFNEIVNDFQAFNIYQIQQQKQQSLHEYGIESLKRIFQFYQSNKFDLFNNCKLDNIMEQYQFSKQRIFEYKQIEISQILKMFDQSEFLKEVGILYKIYLILPLNSVECERTFSQVTSIVTKKRSILAIDTIDTLLFISRNGPSIENLKQFDMIKAIKYWKDDKFRLKI